MDILEKYPAYTDTDGIFSEVTKIGRLFVHFYYLRTHSVEFLKNVGGTGRISDIINFGSDDDWGINISYILM